MSVLWFYQILVSIYYRYFSSVIYIYLYYIFQNARIVLDEHQVVMHSSDAIAPVGILHPLSFHLENKVDVQYLKSKDNIHEICTQKPGSVYEVHDSLEGCEATYKPLDCRADAMDGIEHKFNISRTNNKGTFSLSFWLQDSCNGHSCSLLFLFFLNRFVLPHTFTTFCSLTQLFLISLVQVCKKT